MQHELKIWFIDDEAQLRQAIKECFNLLKEAGWVKDNIYLRIINSGEKGNNALEDLMTRRYDYDSIPDIIFCDLRLSKTEEKAVDDPSQLSGVKLLEEIAKLKEYNSTLLFVFTQVDLSDADKSNILKKLSYSNRKANFLEKTKLNLDSASLDKIENVKIEKTCEYLHSLINYLSRKMQDQEMIKY